MVMFLAWPVRNIINPVLRANRAPAASFYRPFQVEQPCQAKYFKKIRIKTESVADRVHNFFESLIKNSYKFPPTQEQQEICKNPPKKEERYSWYD